MWSPKEMYGRQIGHLHQGVSHGRRIGLKSVFEKLVYGTGPPSRKNEDYISTGYIQSLAKLLDAL